MKRNSLLLMLIVLLVAFNTEIKAGKKKGKNKKAKSYNRNGSTSSLNENLMEFKNTYNNSPIDNKSSSDDQCISAPERLEGNLSKGTGSKASLDNLANANANKVIAIYGNLRCIISICNFSISP